MFKNFFQWLLMSKVKDEAGQMQASGISITKICAVVLGLMQAIEFASPYFGHPIVFDNGIKGGIASIGGIALKEAIDRSAAPKI